MLASESVDHI